MNLQKLTGKMHSNTVKPVCSAGIDLMIENRKVCQPQGPSSLTTDPTFGISYINEMLSLFMRSISQCSDFVDTTVLTSESSNRIITHSQHILSFVYYHFIFCSTATVPICQYVLKIAGSLSLLEHYQTLLSTKKANSIERE